MFNLAENQESNLKVPAVCSLHNRIVKIVTHFPLSQQDAFEALFASTSICLGLNGSLLGGGGGEEAGYVIFMGLEYFKKFLDKPMQRESNFGGC